MTPPERLQGNVLARSERRLLNWLCARLPQSFTPDGMTALGFFGAIMICGGYMLAHHAPVWLWLSIAGYFINWFGDSLDGSIARFRKIERPQYGYFLDHSVDSLAIILIVGGIGLSPYVRLDVSMIPLLGYLLMAIHTFLASKVLGEFQLSHLGGGPTELRIILIIMTLAMLGLGPRPSGLWDLSVFDVFAGGVGIVLVGLFIVQTLKTAKRLDPNRV